MTALQSLDVAIAALQDMRAKLLEEIEPPKSDGAAQDGVGWTGPDDELLTEGEAATLLRSTKQTLNHWRWKTRRGSPAGPKWVNLGGGPRGQVRYRRGDLRAHVRAGDAAPEEESSG